MDQSVISIMKEKGKQAVYPGNRIETDCRAVCLKSTARPRAD